MSSFTTGAILGFAICAAAAGAVAIWAYRRFVVLERRVRQSQRLAELGTLTAGLAHEIKNPLSTVLLNLQLLKEDIPADDPAAPRLGTRLATIYRETARLREILEDFLRYAGKMEIEKTATDLNELLEQLVDFFSPQAQVSRVQLRYAGLNQPLMADVDEKLLKQTVLNLMLNAVQAMVPQSGGELILSLKTEGNSAVIRVTDTGPGIPADTLGRIFDAYYSTKKGGTGLGLAMCRRIVNEHGGTISARSEPGKGSEFTIRLPLSTRTRPPV